MIILLIILSLNQLLVYKHLENYEKVFQCLPEPKMTSSNILFYPQPEDIQTTATQA